MLNLLIFDIKAWQCYNIKGRKVGVTVLDILIMFVAVLLIILSLLQSGKSDGISSAFTGGSGGLNLFANVKERGPEKVIANATMVLGGLFFLFIILTRIV